jgi:hypothetical protein
MSLNTVCGYSLWIILYEIRDGNGLFLFELLAGLLKRSEYESNISRTSLCDYTVALSVARVHIYEPLKTRTISESTIQIMDWLLE